MSSTAPSNARQRTAPARQKFLARFSTDAEKRAYFRDLGRRSAEGRLVLSAEEAAALREAYALLARIAQRAGVASPAGEDAA